MNFRWQNPFGSNRRDFFFGALAASLLLGCEGQQPIAPDQFRMSITGEAQGTTYSIVYYDLQQRNLKPAVDSILARIDASISTYDPGSVISQWNSSDSGTMVDELFLEVLAESWRCFEASDGAFDPTVMPLVRSWGFGPERDQQGELSQKTLDSLLPLVNFQGLVLRNNRSRMDLRTLASGDPTEVSYFLHKPKPSMQLDFNAIGQGWSVDKIAEYLRSLKIELFFVELGGEIVAGNAKPDGTFWRFGIDRPSDDGERQLQSVISLRHRGLATSGNYRKYYEKDGVRYSHTINPKTGRPVSHSLLSATVVTSSAAEADAMATAFMVMGKDSTLSMLRAKPYLGVYVYLIYDSAGLWQTYVSPQLENYIE